MSFTDFYSAYQAADPSVKELIDSEKIGKFVDEKLVNTHELNKEHKKKLIVLISNILIGINTANELPTLLLHILNGKNDVKVIEAEIYAFFNENSLPGTAGAASKIDLTNDIEELEKEVHELQSLRTFASDMKAHTLPPEPTHQSSQESLLNRSSEISNAPRWGTDS